MTKLREIATGLRFPEGPVALADGSVLVVEIEAARLTRVAPDGAKTTIAQHTGGPNGAAIGPDGKVYVCNNGGFNWHELPSGMISHRARPTDYIGRAHRARRPRRPAQVETLYTECDGYPLQGPERHRVRRARRLLVHRPRQAPRARDGPRRPSTTPRPTAAIIKRRVPVDHAQRRRPVAGRQDALLRGDGDRRGCGPWTSLDPAW